MLERNKTTCETYGEESPKATLEARDKARGFTPKGAPRRPFGAIKKHAPLALPAGNEVMHPSVFDGQKTSVASLAGEEAMPCFVFANAWLFGTEA